MNKPNAAAYSLLAGGVWKKISRVKVIKLMINI